MTSMLKRRVRIVAIAALALMPGGTVLAQTPVGSIVGSVTDPSGALLPGVTVVVTNEATAQSRELTTNSEGTYQVLGLLPGIYTVTTTLKGFKTFTGRGVEVRLNQSTRVDISMQLGDVTQMVEVIGQVPLLETQTATVGNVVGQRNIQQLPLNGRDFTQLTLLVPGAVATSVPGGFFINGGQPVAINGNRADQNNYTLDGTYNNNTFFKAYGIRPSVDAIQEFSVQTNITSARYGVGGAHIDISTRSGGNQFHGSAFEFLRNDKLDAVNFFANASPPAAGATVAHRPAFRQNNFGATFGGPIIIPKVYNGHDRTFFFLNYEGLRIRQESTILATVPTPAMLGLNGSFADLSKDTAGNPVPQIYNPFTTCGFNGNPACALDAKGNPILTRQPFAGNLIPVSMIDPVSKLYAQMFYASSPINRAIPGDPNNHLDTTSQRFNNDQFTIRADHRLSSKNNFFGRVSYSNIPAFDPQGLVNSVRRRTNSFRNVTLSDTQIFTPTTVMEFRYGYSRDNTRFFTPYPAPGFPALLDAGLKGLPPKFAGLDTPLNLDSTGFQSASLFTFQNGPDRNHQYATNFMLIRGRNTFNVGEDIKRTHMFHDGQFANWAFTSVPTADPQNVANSGFSLASFLLGLPTDASRLIGNDSLDGPASNYHFYLQDDIKVTPKLTINLGLRYEWSQWFRFPNLGAYDLSNDQYVWATFNPITGQPPNTRNTFNDPDFNNFAPRFGFAYRLGNKTTVRGGYGVFYAGLMTWEASQDRGNWPYAVSQQLSSINTAYPTQGFANVFPSIDITKVPPSIQHTSDRRARWPYIQEWNLHIQRELAQDLMLEVGYVGQKGTKLSQFISANDPLPGPGIVGCPDRTDCLGGPPHPRPHRNEDAVDALLNAQNNRFHALEAKLERRFTSGLSLLASYTWSHNIDQASAFGEGGPQNFYDRAHFYGNSVYDVRHNFILSSLYQLPFGPGRRYLNTVSGPVGKVVEGWDLDSIINFHSGYPYQVSLNFDNLNDGRRSGPETPNLVGNPNSGPKTPLQWFNTSAFAIPQQYVFGNVGRNTMIGPGYKNFDLALHKSIRITETHAIEFRTEWFNAFNNVNFSNPNASMGSQGPSTPGFGTITSTSNAAREIQFALKYLF